MIIFLHGDDSYRSLERLKVLKEGFIKKFDKSGLNVVVLDKDLIAFEDWQKAVAAMGFLSQKRLVVVKNLMSNKKNKEVCAQVAEYLSDKKAKEDNIIIIWEPKQLKMGVLFNQLKKSADKIELFAPLDGSVLSKWVKKEILDQKGKITGPALKLLVDKVGDNLWQMKNEVDKLVSYKGSEEIKEEDVSLFVRSQLDEDIFHLTDALGNKNSKLAMQLIDDQLQSGNHPLALLATLSWQFRNLIMIKEKMDQSANSYSLASELKIHPFVVKKSIGMLRQFSMDKLKETYQGILDIDVKLKTSRVDPEVLLNLFIIKTCS